MHDNVGFDETMGSFDSDPCIGFGSFRSAVLDVLIFDNLIYQLSLVCLFSLLVFLL